MSNPVVNDRLESFIKVSFFVGLAAAAAGAAGFFLQPEHFWHAYLTGFVFIAGITLGCLGLQLLHGLTTGGWGHVIRKYAEAATRTFPILFLFFVPVLLNLQKIYPWVEETAKDPVLMKKALYLNVTGFRVRAVVFFLVWMFLSALIHKKCRELAGSDDETRTRLQLVCGLGMLAFVFSATFAAFDWSMSLTPHWFSTMFGIMTIIGQTLAAIAFLILISGFSVPEGSPAEKDRKTVQGYHDLGNLALAFVMLWAYTNFAQFFIIWSANLPEEIAYFLPRYRNGWMILGLGLILIHFFIPFFLLLNRIIKKSVRLLSRVAIWVLLVRFADVVWTTVPTFAPSLFQISWVYFALPLALAGLWMAAFGFMLRRAS